MDNHVICYHSKFKKFS